MRVYLERSYITLGLWVLSSFAAAQNLTDPAMDLNAINQPVSELADPMLDPQSEMNSPSAENTQTASILESAGIELETEAADRKNIDVIDLSTTDLDALEDEWNSNVNVEAGEVTDSVKINEIVQPPGEYRYSGFGSPDPFVKPETEKKETEQTNVTKESAGIAADGSEIPMVSPLQAYPINQLSVKGIWSYKSGEHRAIIMTPKGEGIIVEKDDPISAGKIIDIQAAKVIVRQYRIGKDGIREFTDTEMKFGKAKKAPNGIIKLNPGAEPEFVRFDEKKDGEDDFERDNPIQPTFVE